MAICEILYPLLLLWVVYASAQDLEFFKAPEDTTSLAGTDVTLDCTVLNLRPIHSVLWYRSNTPLTNGSNILQETFSEAYRFSVMVNQGSGQYNLVIQEVSLSDDANYYCVVHRQGRTNPVLSSAHARLEVHKIPDANFPTCRPLDKGSYKIGETIRLTCISERGNPPVALSWNHGNRAIHIKVTQDDSIIGYRYLHYDLKVEADHQGATFQCKMTTTAASATFQRSCSLGPLDVLFKPIVSVQVSPNPVLDQQTLSLFCDASANPGSNLAFKWSFSKAIDENQLTYSRNNQQLDIVAALINNKTTVTCNATNSEGSGLGRVVLLVLDPAVTVPGSTDNSMIIIDEGSETPPPKGGNTKSSNSVFDLQPEVLAIIAGTLSLIVLVLILLILVTCRCTLSQNKSSPPPPTHPVIYGSPELFYDQGSIYFEPKDRLSVRDMPTLMRPTPWHRTIGVQVPYVEEEDETYEEIGQDWDEGTVELRI